MGNSKKLPLVVIIFGIFSVLLLYLKTSTLFGGDAGDVVTAAFVHGVAHPPGYPLYTFIAWLLTFLPFDTIAGRVSLLSVIPSVGTMVLCFLLSKKLFAIPDSRFQILDSILAFLTTLIFGSTYLFLLLSIIPEVFALHLFFVVLITYLLVSQKWYPASFVFGLSLTHHHTVLLVVPAWGLLLYRTYRSHKTHTSYMSYLKFLPFFLLGLLPYSYVYFAATTNPPVNWENPQTFDGFFRLISRAIYGTFRSGPVVSANLFDRWYQVVLFFQTLVLDFTKLGMFLSLTGAGYLLKVNRKMFVFLTLGFLFTGPLFLFYAAFPLANNFYLGTSERFYLVPYFFFSLFIGFGIMGLGKILSLPRWRIYSTSEVEKLFYLLIFVYPILLLMTTVPKLTSLRNDRTAENLGRDIYQTVTPDSLLVMSEDTRLFAVQFKYFTESEIPHFTLIHLGFMGYPFYYNDAVSRYPAVSFPKNSDPKAMMQDFFAQNVGKFTIFSDAPYPVPSDYRWIPVGILYQLYQVDAQFSDSEYLERNQKLFQNYQDPLSGALGVYRHVMLADVLRVYGNGYREVGRAFEKLGFKDEANAFLEQANRFQPEK